MPEEATPVVTAPAPNAVGDQTPKNDAIESGEPSKDVATLDAQRRHWKEKAETAEQARKDLQVRLDSLSPAPVKTEQVKTSVPTNDLLEFAVFNRDYDREDLTELDAIAKAKGMSLNDAAQSRLFKGYVAEKKREAEAAGGTPSNAERSPSMDREEDFARITPGQVKDMNSEQFVKYEAWLRKQG